jgi:hypothetical protein
MFSFLNLASIWAFIAPIISDLLKEGGKKALDRARSPSYREKFYSLYIALGDFEDNLNKFVDIFEKYLISSEKEKHLQVVPQDIIMFGNMLAAAMETLDKAFQKVFPEYEIYGQNSYRLLYFVMSDEDRIYREIIAEFHLEQGQESQFSNILKGNMGDSYITYGEEEMYDSTIKKNITGWILVEPSHDLVGLRKLLAEAKNNCIRTTEAIEELRQFIKDNIPMAT